MNTKLVRLFAFLIPAFLLCMSFTTPAQPASSAPLATQPPIGTAETSTAPRYYIAWHFQGTTHLKAVDAVTYQNLHDLKKTNLTIDTDNPSFGQFFVAWKTNVNLSPAEQIHVECQAVNAIRRALGWT